MNKLHLGGKLLYSLSETKTFEDQYMDMYVMNNLIVKGITGSGVTYALQHLASQAKKIEKRFIIIDYFDEYSVNKFNHPEWDINDIDIIDLRSNGGKHYFNLLEPIYKDETNSSIANRFVKYISQYQGYGRVMIHSLYEATCHVLDSNKRNDPNNIYKVIEYLDNMHDQSSRNASNRLKNLLDKNKYFSHKGRKYYNWIHTEPGITVIRLDNRTTGTDSALIFSLIDKIKYFYRNSTRSILVFDNFYKFKFGGFAEVVHSAFFNESSIGIWVGCNSSDDKSLKKIFSSRFPLCLHSVNYRGYFVYKDLAERTTKEILIMKEQI